MQPRLPLRHLLLRENVPEDQEGHETHKSTISEGGDERGQVVDHGHAWEHFSSEDHFGHHSECSETDLELGEA